MNFNLDVNNIFSGVLIFLIGGSVAWIFASIIKLNTKVRKLHRDVDYAWYKIREFHPEEARGLREETQSPFRLGKHKARESGPEKPIFENLDFSEEEDEN